MLVRKSGTKTWQYVYKFLDKEKTYTIGEYPLISATEAREKRDLLKKQVKDGIDPCEHKKSEKLKLEYEHKNNFESLAREWHSKQNWVKKHADNILKRLEEDIFHYIGRKPINKINRQEVFKVLQKIEDRNALDVAKRIAQYCNLIFEYALIKGICDNNPAVGLSRILKSRPVKNRAFLREAQLPDFLCTLENYNGSRLVQLAIKLQLLTLLRPGELRKGRWEEIDEKKAIWTVPASRMKMKKEHIVPLSRQALEILRELKTISGKSPVLFPSKKNYFTPISDATIHKAIRIMGYHGILDPHGTRATASTILNDHQFWSEAVERQLAHKERNKVKGSYNHAEHMDERVKMMQWYADHLDNLASSSNV